jgi:hypothetical protein
VKDVRIWDFQNDSIVTFDKGTFQYKLDSLNLEEVLVMNYSKRDSASVWRIKKINGDLISLDILNVLALDPINKKWIVMKVAGWNVILKKTN